MKTELIVIIQSLCDESGSIFPQTFISDVEHRFPSLWKPGRAAFRIHFLAHLISVQRVKNKTFLTVMSTKQTPQPVGVSPLHSFSSQMHQSIVKLIKTMEVMKLWDGRVGGVNWYTDVKSQSAASVHWWCVCGEAKGELKRLWTDGRTRRRPLWFQALRFILCRSTPGSGWTHPPPTSTFSTFSGQFFLLLPTPPEQKLESPCLQKKGESTVCLVPDLSWNRSLFGPRHRRLLLQIKTDCK